MLLLEKGMIGMAQNLIQIQNRSNDILNGYSWTLKDKNLSKGNIVIITGMQETAARYAESAKFFNDHGYNVYCLDHYGQGENAGVNNELLGEWPLSGFRKFVNTVDDLVIELRISCRPTYIIGHSLGSFILQDYIQRHTEHISKVVFVGTGRKVMTPKLGYRLASMLVPLPKYKIQTDENGNRTKVLRKPEDQIPWYKLNKTLHNLSLGNANRRVEQQLKRLVKEGKIPPEEAEPHKYAWLSRDEMIVDLYDKDPLCGGINKGGFYREFFKGLRRLNQRKFLKKIRPSLSILVVAGEDDPVGNFGKEPKRLAEVYQKMGVKDVQLKIYKEMRHEILNEIGRQEVLEDILSFIEEKKHNACE